MSRISTGSLRNGGSFEALVSGWLATGDEVSIFLIVD